MRKHLLLAALACALSSCEGSGGGSPPVLESTPRPPSGMAWVVFDADTVVAEVADTQAERQQGLMDRDRLDAGSGMLFVFEQELPHAFYMRNTLIPLDIAWLDRSLVVVDIQQMEPETVDFHEPARAALYALEVPQGWYSEQEVRVGDLAQIVFGRR